MREFTIIKGIKCSCCSSPMVLDVTQYSQGSPPILTFKCIDKCCGFMTTQVYVNGIRGEED